MSSMLELEDAIAAWHTRRFGKSVDLAKTYRKLLEEAGELGAALIKNDAENAREEIGDMILILCHILRETNPKTPSIKSALERTLAKLLKREAEGYAKKRD